MSTTWSTISDDIQYETPPRPMLDRSYSTHIVKYCTFFLASHIEGAQYQYRKIASHIVKNRDHNNYCLNIRIRRQTPYKRPQFRRQTPLFSLWINVKRVKAALRKVLGRRRTRASPRASARSGTKPHCSLSMLQRLAPQSGVGWSGGATCKRRTGGSQRTIRTALDRSQ